MRKIRPLWFPGLLALLLVVLTTLPYLFAFWHTPFGQQFMGFFFLADDSNTYLAKMRQGLAGSWIWENHYTNESAPGSYIFLFWLALGHLTAFTHLSLYAIFQLARIVGVVFLVFAAWLFIRDFLVPQNARVFALLFLVCVPGGGLVLLLLHEPVLFGQITYALDFRLPEWSLFFSSFSLPSFIWAAASIAFGVVLTFAAAERASWRFALLAVLAWSVLASIHPQMLPFFALLFAFALLCRPPSRSGLLLAALIFATQAPYVFYAYWASSSSPEVAHWLSQSPDNVVPSPLSFLVTLWPQLLPGVFGIAIALRRRSRRDLFLLAWLALEIGILYLPSPLILRRRFLDGFYLPIAIFAVEGLFVLLSRLTLRARSLITFSYLSVGSLLPVFMLVAITLYPPQAAFMPTTEYRLFAVLASQPSGLVLSDDRLGLYIPAYTADTVYVGHYAETFDYFTKTAQVCALFRSGDNAALQTFIATHHVRYLVWTPTCSPTFNFDSSLFPASWRLVYAAPGARVYRVF